MKRLDSILKTALALVIPGAIAIAFPGEAHAQVTVGVGVDVDVNAGIAVAPPDAYIATVQPEYYEGQPVYYYNNYWYYRDRWGNWGYYRTEPDYLRTRRVYWAGQGYGYYRPEYWHHPYRDGYVRGGYYRGGYVRGGYPRGGYVRGGGYVRPAYAGRYHYRR